MKLFSFRVKTLSGDGKFEDFFYVPIEIDRKISFNYFYRLFIYFTNFNKADINFPHLKTRTGANKVLPLIFFIKLPLARC